MIWKLPLDKFTLRYVLDRLAEDREEHLTRAQQVKAFDAQAGEAFMLRAEEVARIIGNIRDLVLDEEEQTSPPKPHK